MTQPKPPTPAIDAILTDIHTHIDNGDWSYYYRKKTKKQLNQFYAEEMLALIGGFETDPMSMHISDIEVAARNSLKAELRAAIKSKYLGGSLE